MKLKRILVLTILWGGILQATTVSHGNGNAKSAAYDPSAQLLDSGKEHATPGSTTPVVDQTEESTWSSMLNSASATPEPGTMALLGLGLLGVGGLARLRKKSS